MKLHSTRHVSGVSNRPFVKVLFLLGIIITAFWIASYFPDLVITLIASVLLAFVLKPLVEFIEFRFGMRRSISIAIVFLLIGGLLTLVAIQFVPMAMERIQTMYNGFKNFPFEKKLSEAAQYLATMIPFTDPVDITNRVHIIIQDGLQALGELLGSIAGFAVNLVIIPFITFFMLAEGDEAIKKLIERVPNKYFEMTLNVLYKIKIELVGYLRGWILDSAIIGMLSMLGYYFIGIDYAILIGIIAGVANLIPYVGPIAGAIPAFLISLTQYGDFQKAIPIFIVTLAVQMIDNIIVQPICFAKSVDMHPVTVIIVLIIGNSLMGIAGMLLAIPIATILKSSAVETYWGLKNYHITA